MMRQGQNSRLLPGLTLLLLLPVALLLFGMGCTSLRPPVPEDPAVDAASPLLQLANPAAGSPADADAPPALRRYRKYWQKHQNRKIRSRYDEIVEAGGGNWGDGYQALIPSLYSQEQFRESARILHEGLLRATGRDRRDIESALINHRLARLVFLTFVAEQRAEEDGAHAAAAEAADRRLQALRAHLRSRTQLHPPSVKAGTN